MVNKINFITGETYNLSEFFSGERKIIIPDLQRDYCWGDAIHTSEKKELVSGFINNLLELYKTSSTQAISLGMIYGYEEPQNHIQLCDGQQRITTLFLLLGILNKHSQNNAFKHYLISNYEYKLDDREPYLNYAIRESSLYFISDLVCHFFITSSAENDEEEIKDVNDILSEKNHWYFGEYNLDPSILSMIKAMKIIYNVLGDKLCDADWVKGFGDYLVHRPTFLYYDMENRRNGEETFVVINTTGEPLSSTQNLKPKVMTATLNKDCSTVCIEGKEKAIAPAWEDIENYFWNKAIIENGNDTGDAGFKEFLRWVVILHNINKDNPETVSEILSSGKYSFDVEEISFKEILDYWLVVKSIFELEESELFSQDFISPKEEEIQKGKDKVRALKQIDCFKLLPIIEYNKVHGCTLTDRNAIRFYQFVMNLTRLDNVSRGINSLVFHIVNMAKKCTDIIELLDVECNKTLMTEEEQVKLSLLKSCKDDEDRRREMEETFWALQADRILDGEIINVIRWAEVDNVFDFELFKSYIEVYNAIFSQKGSHNLLRRALLTQELSNYPSDNGKTLCDTPKEWKSLIDSNSKKIKTYLEGAIGNDPQMYQNNICDSYTNREHPFYDFIKHGYLLDYCDHHHVTYLDDNMMLCKRWRAQPFSVNNAILLFELGASWGNYCYETTKNYTHPTLQDCNWSIWYCVPYNCVVCENKAFNVAIDIVMGNHAKISVFYRSNEGTKEIRLHNLVQLELSESEGRFRCEVDSDIQTVKAMLDRIMDCLNAPNSIEPDIQIPN